MVEKVTGEQLRADIDSGRTGDKVAFPDPAAAPLGTDDEAGGHPTLYPAEAHRKEKDTRPGLGGIWVFIGLIALVAIAAVALVWSGGTGG